eukprot:jgi/Ulvmu1/4313/UM002_0034.1
MSFATLRAVKHAHTCSDRLSSACMLAARTGRQFQAPLDETQRNKDATLGQRSVQAYADSYRDPSLGSPDVTQDDLADSSAVEALLNCINILLGCGILTIPYALKEGGWAAFLVLAIMGASTNYTGKMLIRCQEYYVKYPDESPPQGSSIRVRGGVMQTYEDIAEAAFGSKGRELVSFTLYTELLGTCALFLILQKDHVKLLLESMGWSGALSDATLLALAFAVVLPTTWLPDLSALSYIGAAGFVSALAVTGILAYVYATQPHLAETHLVHLNTLPITFGLLAFVFAGHAVFPTIYASIKREERHLFPRVIDATFIVTALVCGVVGFTGYSAFGDATLEEVTLNIPPGALQLVAIAMVLVSPITKYALTLEPCGQGADTAIQQVLSGSPGARPSLLQKRLTRTFLAGSTLVMAAKVPLFGIFMSILGAFLTLSVSVLFPVAVNLKLHGDELSETEKMVNYGTFVLGFVTAVMGTSLAVQSLIAATTTAGELPFEALVSDAQQGAQILDASHGALKVLVCGSVCQAI